MCGLKLTPLSCLFPGKGPFLPDGHWLNGSLWRIVAGHWSSMQVHPSSISDTAGWQSTYSRSLMNIQFTPTSRVQKTYLYTGESSGISLSLCSLSSSVSPYLCVSPLPLPTSLYMYKLNIGSNMQALISCACFIRGVDQETFFCLTLWASQHYPAPFAQRKNPICPLSAQTL